MLTPLLILVFSFFSHVLFTGTKVVSATATYTGSGCPSYILLDARDQGELQGPSSAFGGVISQTLAAVPNGEAASVVYPADPSIVGAHMAIDWIQSFLKTHIQKCPQSPPRVALLGYGWGGNAISLAAAKFAAQGGPIASSIQAILLVGNLLHTPHRRGNIDEHGGFKTMNSRGATATDNPAILNTFAQRGALLDICAVGDPFCAYPDTNFTAHGIYGLEPTKTFASTFLIKQLRG
ncbi:hypothetical protein OC835_004599 [Tilletia horrida]|nr:hypothetical protein OC835_004599 [Tilletia horrida]